MVILHTDPLPAIPILIFSALVIIVMFATKKIVSNYFVKKTINGRPIMLLLGSSNNEKKMLIRNLTEKKLETKIYPFIGRFMVCDVSLKGKNFCVVSSNPMKDYDVLKKDDIIKTLHEKPSIIAFIIHVTHDIQNIENQWNIFRKAKKLFPKIPAIAVMDKYDKTNRKGIKRIKNLFKNDLIHAFLNKKAGVMKLKSKIESQIKI